MLGSPHSYTADFSGFGTFGRATAPTTRFASTNAAPNRTNRVTESRISIVDHPKSADHPCKVPPPRPFPTRPRPRPAHPPPATDPDPTQFAPAPQPGLYLN